MNAFRLFPEARAVIKRQTEQISPRRRSGPSLELEEMEFRATVLDSLERHGAFIDDLIENRSAGRQEMPKGPWDGFGQFLSAVRLAASPGGMQDTRLMTRAASGLNESAPSDGGFLVPQQYSDALMTRSLYTSRLAPMCTTIPITKGNKISLPVPDETSRADGARFGGVFSYYKNEAEQGIASRPKLRNVDLELQKMLAFCFCTDEMLQDTPVLGKFVTQAFTEETSFRIDQAIFSGSGSGQPLGFLNSTALYTVAKEDNQAAASIVPANIYNMWGHMLARSKPNAAWLISDDIEAALLGESLTPGMYASPEAGEDFGTLLGRPVIPIEFAKPLGMLGDITLVDLSDYLLAINDMQTALSLEVRFLYDESLFRFSWRFDGQPALRTPVIPYQGNNLRSSYVALAPRT